ncbi:MAG: hypothetical protein NC906_05765 [Candidatus Omnitrophica bacterium]|nr:hypothetical protein [Candidatus Omnitrophota bacterium]
MKKVLHFGAGNIGRGFFGQLYYESGYHIIFVDVIDDIIETLNKKKEYPLWLVAENTEKLTIKNISGIKSTELSKIVDTSIDVNLISFSVGVNNVKQLIPILKKIIEEKSIKTPDSYLDIIIGENIKDASKILRQMLLENLEHNAIAYFTDKVGLVETVLGRMIPIVPEELKRQYPLIILAEPYKTMPVAKGMFKGELPEIKDFLFVENIEPYEAMKLYIHNFTHAALAYAGHLKGYNFIWQALEDEKIKNLLKKAYLEIKQAINKRYNVPAEELDDYYNDLLSRFSNKALGDTIARVGREPIRKMGNEDRIIGAAKLCQQQGIFPENICFFAACCLYYNEPTDAESQKLISLLKNYGVDYVLQNISGLCPDTKIFCLIKQKYIEFWKIWERVL